MDNDRWNEWAGMWTEYNKMKHEQWSAGWRKWDETWTRNWLSTFLFFSLSLTTLLGGK